MTKSPIVMVVDDERELRESLCDLLRDEGYDVVGADGGHSALRLLRGGGRCPSLILLDLMMPGMDGWQFREEQLRDHALASIPVIVLTASRDVRGITAEGVIFKPPRLDRLLDLIRRFSGEVRPAAVALADLPRSGAGPTIGQARRETEERCRVLTDHVSRLEQQLADEKAAHAAARFEVGELRRSLAIKREILETRGDEDRYGRLVNQVNAGIAQTDLAGRFVLANERYREIVGRSERELLQVHLPDITHADDLIDSLGRFRRVIESGTPAVAEQRFVKPDGSIVWVQNSLSRIQDHEGQPRGVATVTVDITRRKYAEDALRESEERFRTIFETAEVSIWEEDFSSVTQLVESLTAEHGDGLRRYLEAHPAVVDQASELVRVRDVNAATLVMFGAAHKNELLRSLSAIFVPETRAVFLDELMALAEGRQLFSAEAQLRRLTGERIDVLLTVRLPVRGDVAERVLVTLVDISARKIAEVEREARVAEMERVVHVSEMFVGILGHDLRNPLSSIATAANLLEMRADSERIAKPVSRIVHSADRMERMIAQLLDFTRIRLGRGLSLERTDTDLAEVARSVIDELEPIHKCEIRLDAIGDLAGVWDRDLVYQLVSNLTGNACQHGTPGTPVVVALDGSNVDVMRLCVSNQGAVSPELMPVLFDPLGSTELRKKRERPGGVGLGLYISKQIAMAHGGAITVISTDAEGTSFRVELPRHPVHAQEGGEG